MAPKRIKKPKPIPCPTCKGKGTLTAAQASLKALIDDFTDRGEAETALEALQDLHHELHPDELQAPPETPKEL